MNYLMLNAMPPGPTNRTRPQLQGAATNAIAVCNVSAPPVGEADQHLTTRQQRCEELRKRSFTLRSHACESADGRGPEHVEKSVRCTTTHRSAGGALPSGKHQQQRNDQSQPQQQQQHFTPRYTRRAKSDIVACSPSEDHNTSAKPLKLSGSAASRSAADGKELPAAEAPIETAPAAAATPITGENRAVPSAASPDPASSETASTKEDEDARNNRVPENPEPLGDDESNKGAGGNLSVGKSQIDFSPRTLCCLDASPASQTAHVLEKQEEKIAEQLRFNTTDTGHGEKGDTTKNSASNSDTGAPLHNASSAGADPQAPDQGSFRSIGLPVLEDDVRETSRDATAEDRTPESPKRQAAEQQDKQKALASAGGSPMGDGAIDALHTTGGYHSSAEQQRGLPDQGAHFEMAPVQGCQSEVAGKSGDISEGTEKSTLLHEPVSPREAPEPMEEKDNNAVDVSAENEDTLHHMREKRQVSQEEQHVKGEDGQSDDEQALRKAQMIGQSLDEQEHRSPPPLPKDQRDEEEEDECRRRPSVGRGGGGEVGKQVTCASGGAREEQRGDQERDKSEHIRFFLRLGGGGGSGGDQTSSSRRSVHVSRAFLKDSCRAQRFFCKLLGVDIGEVIGLVDEQGFVSPVDGEELFIRNGGTYTLELAQNARRRDMKEIQTQNLFAAGPISSESRADKYAHQSGEAGSHPIPRGGITEDSMRTNDLMRFDGKKGTWRPPFANESVPIQHEAMIPAVPDGDRKRNVGPVSVKTGFLRGQEATPQEFSRGKGSVTPASAASASASEPIVAERAGAHQDLVNERSRGLLSAVLPSPHHPLLPPRDHKQAWRQPGASTSTSNVAGGSVRMKEVHRDIVMLHRHDDTDMRNERKGPIWGSEESGETQEMMEQLSSSAMVTTSRVISRSIRQPTGCAVDDAPAFVSNDMIESRNSLHGAADHTSRGGGQVVNEKKLQEPCDREDGRSLRGGMKQEVVLSAEEGGSSGMHQHLGRKRETWGTVGADGREEIERYSFMKAAKDAQREGINKQQWGSMLRAEEATSTDVTDEEVFLTEQAPPPKRCRLVEDGHCTTLQRLGAEEDYIPNNSSSAGALALTEEELLERKQQQAKRSASKLWISAPLLVWRRRRLRRSLALHEPEDPEEVATRQLVAEQHVRAVLARVSQRKALRTHLQTGLGAQTIAHESRGGRDDTTTNFLRRQAAPSSLPLTSRTRPVEVSNRSVAASPWWPSSSSSSSRSPSVPSPGHSERLLVNSLLWKKATTEKIYVHQAPSYGGIASYPVKESDDASGALQHANLGRRSNPISFSEQLHEQHVAEQQPHRWRDVVQQGILEGAARKGAAAVAAIGEGISSMDEKMKANDEEAAQFPSKVAEHASTSSSLRQYLLRPRLGTHTQIFPDKYKDYSTPGNNSSSSEHSSNRKVQQQQAIRGGTILRNDYHHPFENKCFRRRSSGDERQDVANFTLTSSFPRDSSKLNKCELKNNAVRACDSDDSQGQEVVLEDAAGGQLQTEISAGGHGHFLLTSYRSANDKSASPDRRHEATRRRSDAIATQASSADGKEHLDLVSYGGSRNNSSSSSTSSSISSSSSSSTGTSSSTTTSSSSSTSSSSTSSTRSSIAASGDGHESEKSGCHSKRHEVQQHFLQQALEKRLFTSSELQRLLAVLETLKAPQQQQQHNLVERLRALLPPQTFSNLKLLLPTLLQTTERLKKATDEEESLAEKGK